MKYFVLLVIAVFFSIEDYAASVPSPEGFYKEPVDCKWTAWHDGKCVVTKGNFLRRSESRFKKPGQNGGKDCEGDSEKLEKSCSESEYMAQVFINTFTQGGKPPPGAQSKKNKTKDSDDDINSRTRDIDSTTRHHLCSNPRSSPTNRWRISGRNMGCWGFSPAAEPSPAPAGAPKPIPEWNQNFGVLSRARGRGKREIEDSPETDKPAKNQTYIGNQTLDILFLIDESASVGEEDFKKELRFMRETLKKLCGKIEISLDKTRVALTTYDTVVHDLMSFKDSTNINGLLERLDGVRYNDSTDGGTCLASALQHVMNLFTEEYGARDNDDLYDLVVLVTDGCANCGGDLGNVVQQYTDQDITLLLVTIDDYSYCSETISELAYGNHCFLNYEIGGWREFDDFIEDIKNIDCQDQWKLPDTSCP